MSAVTWAALIERARQAGAGFLMFEVNIERFSAGPEPGIGLDRSWCIRSDDIAITRFGRTGEEALRALVDAMESKKEKEDEECRSSLDQAKRSSVPTSPPK